MESEVFNRQCLIFTVPTLQKSLGSDTVSMKWTGWTLWYRGPELYVEKQVERNFYVLSWFSDLSCLFLRLHCFKLIPLAPSSGRTTLLTCRLHFSFLTVSIMPLVGWSLRDFFAADGHVAAGLCLVKTWKSCLLKPLESLLTSGLRQCGDCCTHSTSVSCRRNRELRAAVGRKAGSPFMTRAASILLPPGVVGGFFV